MRAANEPRGPYLACGSQVDHLWSRCTRNEISSWRNCCTLVLTKVCDAWDSRDILVHWQVDRFPNHNMYVCMLAEILPCACRYKLLMNQIIISSLLLSFFIVEVLYKYLCRLQHITCNIQSIEIELLRAEQNCTRKIQSIKTEHVRALLNCCGVYLFA